MSRNEQLDAAAQRLINLLRRQELRVVFAESCTAGLIAATLGRTPGVSEYLCGSAVVYREGTKTAWLDVPAEFLADPQITAVSPEVAEAMSVGVLTRTPEAHLAASVTGYLGPDSAPTMDGIAWVSVAVRLPKEQVKSVLVRRVQLTLTPDRSLRQIDAARHVLELTAGVLEADSSR